MNIIIMRRIFKTVLFFVLVALLIMLSINFYVKSATADRIMKISKMEEKGRFNCDAVLVLGAGVYPDNRPTPMLKERLDSGILLYKKELAPKIIMSGDHGQEKYDEVNVMKQYAVDTGVPSEDIFMDHAGFSTYDSIYRAKHIFGANRLIIVSQKYHLYRALNIADSLGMTAIGIDAQNEVRPGQIGRDIREFIAIDKDFIKAKFKPEPKVLGDKIPLSSSGDITNDK